MSSSKEKQAGGRRKGFASKSAYFFFCDYFQKEIREKEEFRKTMMAKHNWDGTSWSRSGSMDEDKVTVWQVQGREWREFKEICEEDAKKEARLYQGVHGSSNLKLMAEFESLAAESKKEVAEAEAKWKALLETDPEAAKAFQESRIRKGGAEDADAPPAKRLRPDSAEACSQFADDPRLEREHANAKNAIMGVVQELICPIEQTPVYDAVLAADGYIYERRAISEWFDCASSKVLSTDLVRSPSTGAPLPNNNLISVPAIKNSAQRLVESGTLDIEMIEAWEEKRKDYARLEQQAERAKKGDANAIYAMGLRQYSIACDTKYNTAVRERAKVEAVYWFQKGSEVKNVKSIARYGRALVRGWGVAKTPTKGVYLLMQGAYAGSDVACYTLGMALAGFEEETIDGVSIDHHDARMFLEMMFEFHRRPRIGETPKHPFPEKVYKHLNHGFLEKAQRVLAELPPCKKSDA